MFKIRRGDTVAVMVGKDRGKQGKVIHVYPALHKVLVEGINYAKKHKRRTQQEQQGGSIYQVCVDLEITGEQKCASNIKTQ